MVNDARPPLRFLRGPLGALLISPWLHSHCRRSSLVAPGTRSSVTPPTPCSWSYQTPFVRWTTREPCVPQRSSLAVSVVGSPHTSRATGSHSAARSLWPRASGLRWEFGLSATACSAPVAAEPGLGP